MTNEKSEIRRLRKEVGNFLRGKITERGCTQVALAAAAGISDVWLCNILNGKANASFDLMGKLLWCLDIRAEIVVIPLRPRRNDRKVKK
jgi:transcriptional regulator with XRE-family HTH domain